jgi:integrase/recombinase XerD
MENETYKEYLYNEGYAEQTAKGYDRVAKTLHAWLKLKRLPVGKVQHSDLLDFKDFLIGDDARKSRGAINDVKSLKHYFNYLGFKVNPVGLLDFAKREKNAIEGMLSEMELFQIYEGAEAKTMVQKRDKAILGMIVFCAVKREELSLMEITDLELEKEMIKVPGTKVTNSRVLDLHVSQLRDLKHYLFEVREELLVESAKPDSPHLFFSQGSGNSIGNVLNRFIPRLRKLFPQIKGTTHIRNSRITIWVNELDAASAQYRSGFKYMTSLEPYEKKEHEELKKKLAIFHPLRDM